MAVFNNTVVTILRSNDFNLSYSDQYISFLTKLIKNINYMDKSLLRLFVRECLKLCVLRR